MQVKMWKDDYGLFLEPQLCARTSVSPTNETTRRGNQGHYIHVCPSPSVIATVYLPLLLAVIASGIGALPHSSRKQQTHFTWMYIVQEMQKASWANRVFYAPPGADRHSISNTT